MRTSQNWNIGKSNIIQSSIFLLMAGIQGHLETSERGLINPPVRLQLRSSVWSGIGAKKFWDEKDRVAKLQQNNSVLRRISGAKPLETFRARLEEGYTQERKSNATQIAWSAAISWIILRPLIPSMATLALTSGMWARRLLLDGSPDQGRAH